MEIWKSQKRGFPHFHRLGGYDDKNEVPNPKNRTESVKNVPGLKCKTCPRLDTVSRDPTSGILVIHCSSAFDEGKDAGEGACVPQLGQGGCVPRVGLSPKFACVDS